MHAWWERRGPKFLLCCAFLFALAGGLAAQNQNGEIELHVRDASGAVMQANGRLESTDTRVHRRFHTDMQGRVRLEDLPPGTYHVDIFRSGFASQSLSIDLGPGRTALQTITMQPAAQSFQTDVVSATPLVGPDLTADQIASPVQSASSDDLRNSGALDLADFLSRRFNGVYFNETQENPFQPDVNYRGYTASPLLGTPQGISVYVDGVRQNQPFGDVVSWDLIPKDAISDVTLLPGSDPLFGLNTLGGALSLTTKNGITNPGISRSVLYGSSGRKAIQGDWGGGAATGFNWFFSGMGFHESGWRYDSPSDVRQGFARLGWRTTTTDLALTLSYAYNTLLGSGQQDYRLLQQNYASAYSVADSTANRSPSFNFIARHAFSDALTFSGNAWYRNIRTETINPNFNNDVAGNDIYQPTADQQAVLSAAGYSGFPVSGANISNTPFPKWPCIAEAITPGGDPDSACDGVNIYGKEVQNDFGLSGQFSLNSNTRVGHNLFAIGALFDSGAIDYTQSTAFAYVNPNYSLTSVPAWQNSPVDLHGVTPNWSIFLTDTLTLPHNINLTVSGRYNRATVDNTDRLNPVAGPGSLTGDYTFQRFDPAIGLTWSPTPSVNLYGRFAQGSRAPTSIELGCADPAAPCSLPNSLSSDPPLAQVVTNTWEAGARGKLRSPVVRNLRWNLDAFRAENHNDILFIAAPITGTGYFQNFAKTRREGLDASLDGSFNRFTWGVNWTLLSATYQSVETLNGSANNTSDVALAGYPGLSGVITVHPGNLIPHIPKHTGKAYVNFQPVARLGFDLNEVVASSSYARGNENNAYQPDGLYYLGPGTSPGYAVTDLRLYYDLAKHFQLALQVDNIFDRKYYTVAQLASTSLTAQGAVQSTPFPAYDSGPYVGSAPAQSVTFFSPGAPRRAWVQLDIKF